MPTESRSRTLVTAFLVAAACALLVSTATVVLRPIQAANRAAEEAVRLEALLAQVPGISDLLEQPGGGTLVTTVIDLETGRADTGLNPSDLPEALEDPSNWTELPPEADTAGIGARPDVAQVFLLRENDRVALLVLPVIGAGYNGPIRGMLALRGDTNTIAGLTILDQSETPGLGARITETSWQAEFPGTRLRDDTGALRFEVTRGSAATDFEVDGITGATRTSNAITRMIRFWAGPDGFGPFLEAVRDGEF